MSLRYVIREADPIDLGEIRTLMSYRQRRFMSRLTLSLTLSNWYPTLKYLVIGIIACLNFESFWPLVPCAAVVPVMLFVEVFYSYVVTTIAMRASLKSIEKRVKEGNTDSHQVWIVRRLNALVGILSLRDQAGTKLCMDCDLFHCREATQEATLFVLKQTLKTACEIADQQKFSMILFRCCDIFPDVMKCFESTGFSLIMIHRVMILFSQVLMLTYTKVLSFPDDLTSLTVHIPGLQGPDPLTDNQGEPVQARASVASAPGEEEARASVARVSVASAPEVLLNSGEEEEEEEEEEHSEYSPETDSNTESTDFNPSVMVTGIDESGNVQEVSTAFLLGTGTLAEPEPPILVHRRSNLEAEDEDDSDLETMTI